MANCFNRTLDASHPEVAALGLDLDLDLNTEDGAASSAAGAVSAARGSSQTSGEGAAHGADAAPSNGTQISTPGRNGDREDRENGVVHEAPSATAHACVHISSFMIGVSFKKGSKFADLQPAVQVRMDFLRGFSIAPCLV